MRRIAGLSADPNWRTVADDQCGIISKAQLICLGLTASQARQWVRTQRWRRVFRGVYATFTGPLPERARIWAVLLHAGRASVTTGRTALWLLGVPGDPPRPIHIAIPAERFITAPPGVRVTRHRHPTPSDRIRGSPPCVPVEEATLDACDITDRADTVLTIVFRVTQGRFSTAPRLRSALAQRRRHRWRALLTEVLADIQDGVASALELRYLRTVERAHGLPRGNRNRPERLQNNGFDQERNAYRDVRYPKWRMVIELDGRGAHPDESRFRDMRRDNSVTISGEMALRYGWHDVAVRPCLVAAQVISALRRQGWSGQARPCGPGCPVS